MSRLVTNPLHLVAPPEPIHAAVRDFHRGLPDFATTPLRHAPGAAKALGVRSVLVKDESDRAGLPSFKILGASWATYLLLCGHLGVAPDAMGGLTGLRTRLEGQHPLVLVAATDGNHGRAVARMAHYLGLSAHVLVPADMAAARIAALRAEGARVSIVDGGYDEAVRASASLADDRHLVVSDTSWPGYTDVPGWVIEGYATIWTEITEQLAHASEPMPSVLAVQIGVGAFAAGVVRHARGTLRILGVEPTSADCVTASIEAGRPTALRTPQTSIMAGLNCGIPSTVAWPTVSTGIDLFAAVDDADAEAAMRLLAADGIVAGESGAAGLAGLVAFRTELRLGIGDSALIVVTEGATDPAAYARIMAAPPPFPSEKTDCQPIVAEQRKGTDHP